MLILNRAHRILFIIITTLVVILGAVYLFSESSYKYNPAILKVVDTLSSNIYKSNTFLIPKIISSPVINGKKAKLLILINSSPYNHGRRNAIRNSWGACEKLHYLYAESKLIPKEIICLRVFMVGKMVSNDTSLALEAKTYNDMIIVDHIDKYNTITYKLLASFKWASNIYPNYVLKADDDVFVHLPRLILEILSHTKKRFYGGVPYSNGRVMRDKNHKHFVSYSDFNEQRYPSFCRGDLYLFSGDILPEILNASEKIPIFGVDDAFVGILMRNIGVFPQHIEKFIYVELKGILDFISDCSLKLLIGFGDGLTEYQIIDVHNRINMIDSSTILGISCFKLQREVFFIILVLVMLFIFYTFYVVKCFIK